MSDGPILSERGLNMPGGQIGFESYTPGSPAQLAVESWKQKLGVTEQDITWIKDPEFVEQLINSVPDHATQLELVRNSIKFDRADQTYDPNFVLAFRRTTPKIIPAPERHWTTEYITARRGLRREIQGPQRLHTVILCTTLTDLLADVSDHQFQSDLSDGEIQIDSPSYDQQRVLVSFRPKDQQQQLDTYLQAGGAMNLEQLNTDLTAHFTQRNQRPNH